MTPHDPVVSVLTDSQPFSIFQRPQQIHGQIDIAGDPDDGLVNMSFSRSVAHLHSKNNLNFN